MIDSYLSVPAVTFDLSGSGSFRLGEVNGKRALVLNEETVVATLELPAGRDWELYADANVVALAPHLDQCGRERALQEVGAHWSRRLLHVVPGTLSTAMAAAMTTALALLPIVAQVPQV